MLALAACAPPANESSREAAQRSTTATHSAMRSCRMAFSQSECACVERVLSASDFDLASRLFEIQAQDLSAEEKQYRSRALVSETLGSDFGRLSSFSRGLDLIKRQCGVQ
ncbi:MAG TPA: hypothetical protein VG943_00405 [Caulobacterales bacterium]|nr:hypothetical protein [Caulobacterales bacterium]